MTKITGFGQDVLRKAGGIPQDVAGAVESYIQLSGFTCFLEKSRLLRLLSEDTSILHWEQRQHAEKMKRRLTKACQYYRGTGMLIKRAKRLLASGNVSHCWVDDTISATSETALTLTDNLSEAISHTTGGRLADKAVDQLKEEFPDVEEMWLQRRVVNPRLHAEIRIILHFNDPLDHTASQLQRRPIGCSKRSCFCCTMWIASYTRKYWIMWRTSEAWGKSFGDWALPGNCVVDELALRRISSCVNDTVSRLLPDDLYGWTPDIFS